MNSGEILLIYGWLLLTDAVSAKSTGYGTELSCDELSFYRQRILDISRPPYDWEYKRRSDATPFGVEGIRPVHPG